MKQATCNWKQALAELEAQRIKVEGALASIRALLTVNGNGSNPSPSTAPKRTMSVAHKRAIRLGRRRAKRNSSRLTDADILRTQGLAPSIAAKQLGVHVATVYMRRRALKAALPAEPLPEPAVVEG